MSETARIPDGVMAASLYMQVVPNFGDNGISWVGNPASASADDICRWFKRGFFSNGLAKAIVMSPRTEPRSGPENLDYHDIDPQMQSLGEHRKSLETLEVQLGHRVFTSVVAQIVPKVFPLGRTFTFDIPFGLASLHD